ncbi:MAG: DUF2924 domain-containing protein [Pseudomonadota bacterium]
MTVFVDIHDIEAMSRKNLLSLWQQVFGGPAPKGLSQSLLRRFLAFELQARRHGGLSAKVKRVLEKGAVVAAQPQSPMLKPGGRLLREWNGITHVVDVTEGGFVWKGETWRSLSAIAREITGAHWSGPRVFGLTNGTKR